MSRQLSAQDQLLWQQLTKTVTPLANRPQPQVYVPAQPTNVPQPARHFHPRHTVDLHGMTLRAAYETTLDHIQAAAGRYQTVTVITGQSGSIRQEFGHWLADHPLVARVTEIKGGGSFAVRLTKRG